MAADVAAESAAAVVASADASSNAADLDPAIEAALPEDAPPNHVAHQKVRYEPNNKWPLAVFMFGEAKTRFQVTLGNTGSQRNCEVIARACYMRFERGDTLEMVKQFRQECYDRLKEARGIAVKPSTKPRSQPVRQQAETSTKSPAASVEKLQASPTASPEASAGEDKTVQPASNGGNAGGNSGSVASSVKPISYDTANTHFAFLMPDQGKQVKVTVSLTRAGGPQEAYRITKLLHDEAAAGKSRAHVVEHRNVIMADYAHSTKVSAEVLTEWHREALEIKAKGGVTQSTQEAGPPPKKARKAESPAAAADAAPIAWPQDAPAGHVAHEKVRRKGDTAFCFYYALADGSKPHFQATLQACNNSAEDCARVARLCYMKFESGATLEEVKAYRGTLYSLFGGGKPQGASNKGTKSKAVDPARATKTIIKRLRTEGRLTGAIQLKGRAVDAKNASINGVYALLSNGFSDRPAYEKIEISGQATQRYLFFSARKGRWKVNDSLDDSKGGFAYARTSDDGRQAPSESSLQLRWHVFEGKEKGYSEDLAVSCTPLVKQAAAEKVASASSDSEDSDSAASASSDSSSSSGSAAQGSEGAGSDREGEDGAGKAAATGDAQQASTADVTPEVRPSSTAAADAAAAQNPKVSSRQAAPTRGRVCAKMLARGLLRCPCHFMYIGACPNLRQRSLA
eukprot:TRINITY_DN4703_c0_g1_i1.p1 TRINITY_DN4703_c0_g1~~TRINITY_DN4703_c0_g1_i1.p1  ORF type:complete len:684 (-),score=107.97 TRINITY_DN4703_c0_g1_i1:64-2115(-)